MGRDQGALDGDLLALPSLHSRQWGCGIRRGHTGLLGQVLSVEIDLCLGNSLPPQLFLSWKSYKTLMGNPRCASCSQAMEVSGSLANKSEQGRIGIRRK